MSIRIMLTIVRAFGVLALAATLLAIAGGFSSQLADVDEELEPGSRLHVVIGLAAGLTASAAHGFFVFFLPRAAIGLAAAGQKVPGWGLTVLLSFLAASSTIAALALGVQALTESSGVGLHRGLSFGAVALQIAALVAQSKASSVVAGAEAEDRSAD